MKKMSETLNIDSIIERLLEGNSSFCRGLLVAIKKGSTHIRNSSVKVLNVCVCSQHDGMEIVGVCVKLFCTGQPPENICVPRMFISKSIRSSVSYMSSSFEN